MPKYRIAGRIYDAGTPAQAQAQHKAWKTTQPNVAEAAVVGFGQGAGAGLADELRGGIEGFLNYPMQAVLAAGSRGPFPFNVLAQSAAAARPEAQQGLEQAYTTARDSSRDYFGTAEQQHPLTYGAGNAAGAVTSGVTGARLAPAAAGAGQAVVRGLGIGAGEGALAGYGEATDDPLTGALTGAALGMGGAAAGEALPVVGKAAATLWRTLREAPDAAAERIIAQVAREAGISPQAARAELDRLPPQATLADAYDVMLALTAGARARSPRAAQDVLNAIWARQDTSRGRIESALVDAAVGAQERPRDVMRAVGQAKRQIRPGYEALSGQLAPITPELQAIIDTPHGQTAYAAALREWQTVNRTDIDPLAVAGGVPGDMLDRMKKHLDAAAFPGPLASSVEKAGGAVNRDLRRELVTEADAALPGYAATRRAWGERVRQPTQALLAGRNLFQKTGLAQEELLREAPLGTQDAVRALRIGALDSARRAVGRVPNAKGTANLAGALLRTDDTERGLRALSGNRARLDRLVGALEGEQRMHETFRMLAPGTGSRTAILQQAGEQADEASRVVKALINRSPSGMLIEQLSTKGRMSAPVAEQIVARLMKAQPTPAELNAMLSSDQIPFEVKEVLRRHATPWGAGGGAAAASLGGGYLDPGR